MFRGTIPSFINCVTGVFVFAFTHCSLCHSTVFSFGCDSTYAPTPITTAKPCASKIESTRKRPGTLDDYIDWSTDFDGSPDADIVQGFVQSQLNTSRTEIDVAVDVASAILHAHGHSAITLRERGLDVEPRPPGRERRAIRHLRSRIATVHRDADFAVHAAAPIEERTPLREQ